MQGHPGQWSTGWTLEHSRLVRGIKGRAVTGTDEMLAGRIVTDLATGVRTRRIISHKLIIRKMGLLSNRAI